MITVTVEIKGKDEAINSLDKIKNLLGDFKPEMKAVGDYLLDFFTNDVFDSQGSAIGSQWEPLSEPYSTYKAKMWGAGRILIASGKMRASYKLYTGSDYLIVRNEALNRYGDYYARYHQDGTEKMPQRQLMKFDATRGSKIADMIVTSLNKRIANVL